MNLNLNNHMWPFATVLDGTAPNDSPALCTSVLVVLVSKDCLEVLRLGKGKKKNMKVAGNNSNNSCIY